MEFHLVHMRSRILENYRSKSLGQKVVIPTNIVNQNNNSWTITILKRKQEAIGAPIWNIIIYSGHVLVRMKRKLMFFLKDFDLNLGRLQCVISWNNYTFRIKVMLLWLLSSATLTLRFYLLFQAYIIADQIWVIILISLKFR